MNTEQIIKELEEITRRLEAFYDGMNIPKELRPSENKKALELIKGQKAEIERLNVVVDAMKGEIDGLNKDLNRWKDWYASLIEAQKRTVQGKQELIAQIENLAKENKYLRESLAEEREHKKDMEGVKNEHRTGN